MSYRWSEAPSAVMPTGHPGDGRERRLNWDDLKVVLAIGRTGSITRAASQLGMNQSTATRRLVALERDVGATLFVRTQSGLTPTETGTVAIARAAEVEHQMDLMRDQLQDNSNGAAGLVHLRGDGWVLKRLVERSLSRLLSAHPHLQLRLAHQQGGESLARGATVSLWLEREPRDMEFAVKLGTIPYAVYANASNTCENTHWAAYLDEHAPGLAPSRRGERLRGADDRLQLTASDDEIVLSAVKSGVGRALLPICLAQDEASITRVADGPPDFHRELIMHLHPDTVQMGRVQAVVNWLRESFSETFAPCDLA